MHFKSHEKRARESFFSAITEGKRKRERKGENDKKALNNNIIVLDPIEVTIIEKNFTIDQVFFIVVVLLSNGIFKHESTTVRTV